ncbi:cohesin domain-containing protein [Chloroflexota bacterium]
MLKRRILTLLLAFIILLTINTSVATAQSENLVDLVMEPPEITGKRGGTFELAIKAIPNGQKLVAMDVFLDFDPVYLEVVDSNPDVSGIQIDPGTILTSLMAAEVDNSNGRITHSTAMFGRESPDDVFTVANITFRTKATAAAGATEITFHTEIPRKTEVAYDGNSVLGLISGATVTMEAASVPLPTIASSPPPTTASSPPPTTESSLPPTSESAPTPPPEEVPESAEKPEPTMVTEETGETQTTPTKETEPASTATSASSPTATTTTEPVRAPSPTPEASTGFAWWILLIIVPVVVGGLGGFIIMRRRM